MSVLISKIEGKTVSSTTAAAGFLLGAGSGLDYRGAALVHHNLGEGGGLLAGIGNRAMVFIGEPSEELTLRRASPENNPGKLPDEIELRLVAEPSGDLYTVTITALDIKTGKQLRRTSK